MADTLVSPVVTARLDRQIIVASVLAVGLTGASYLIAAASGWISQLNLLEAFAVATSFACTYLAVKQRRVNYPIGAVSTAAYAVLFWQQGLLASALLNAYLTPSLVYGWLRWRADSCGRPVSLVRGRWWPMYVAVTAVAYLGANLLATALGGQLAPTDAAILIGSILAQFLLDNKKIETWAVWAVVNVAAIYTYFNAGLPVAAIQYVFFLANAGYGAWSWRRTITGVER
jgi:nicotinamide mononucleotide transporter